MPANHKATAFDTQSVTVEYFQGSASMTAYLVPGSPYMTFQYSGATPSLKSMHGGIQTFNGQELAVGGTGGYFPRIFSIPSHPIPSVASAHTDMQRARPARNSQWSTRLGRPTVSTPSRPSR